MLWFLVKQEMKQTILFWMTIPIFLFVTFLFRDQAAFTNPTFIFFILFLTFGPFTFFNQTNFRKMLLTTPIPLKTWIQAAFMHNFLFLFYCGIAIFIITLYTNPFHHELSSLGFSVYAICIFFLLASIKVYLEVRYGHDTPGAYFAMILVASIVFSFFFLDVMFKLTALWNIVVWTSLIAVVACLSYYCYVLSIKHQYRLRYVVKGKIAEDFVETIKIEQEQKNKQ